MKTFTVFNVVLFGIILFSYSYAFGSIKNSIESNDSSRIESFSFSNDGKTIKGKIYLPDSYPKNKNLPAIFLIDYTEQ
ncbi:MAG: hypothetical protein ABFS32_15240, partial [Bacteroidota bacterium]